MSASSELIWECVKGSSSFLRKSVNMPTMTAEPGNLCGINSFKYSGIASKKVLGLSSGVNGKKESIVLTTSHKKASRAQRPKSRVLVTGVKKNPKQGLEALSKIIDAGFYRTDLSDMAKKKYMKIQMSFRKRKFTPKSRRAGK